MPKSIIIPAGAPAPLAPYSPGTLASGSSLYVSGMVPVDSDGKTVAVGDVSLQTKNVLEAVQDVVVAAGGTMGDVTFSMIFLKSMNDYQKMNEVYKEFFPKNQPARYCIRADLVRDDFLVEIACFAHV